MTDLDDRLREHFGALALSPEALARIHARAETSGADAVAARESDPSPGSDVVARGGRRATDGAGPVARLRARLAGRDRPRRHAADRPFVATLAAIAPRAALAATLAAVLAVAVHSYGSLAERTDRTLREVAMNHAARLTFEFEEDTLAGLDRHMRLLPFEMTAPERLPGATVVLGSRYCSLAGRLAAHVKLRDVETGRPLSLFVTAATADLEGLDGDVGRIDGVEVELFREGGLFYALARPAG